jgi:hypothetical protein
MDDIQDRIETARAYLSKFQQAAYSPGATDEDIARYERSRRILAEAERDEQRQRAGALERRCRELEKSAASSVNAKKKKLTARQESEELAAKVFGKS